MWHTPKNIQAEWHKPLFDKGINDTEIYRFFDAIDEYMQIEDQKNLDQFDLDSKKLVSACKRLNWKIVPARRAVQSCKRRNQCGAGCPSGAKKTMVNSCLENGVINGGTIKTEIRVEKLIIRNARVVEVRCINLRGNAQDLCLFFHLKYFYLLGR